MHMLYNSDSFVVVRFDLPPRPQAELTAQTPAPTTGGYEIVDKFARKEIFIVGAVAQRFQQGVQALVEGGPSEEKLDDFISGFTALAQQPVALH